MGLKVSHLLGECLSVVLEKQKLKGDWIEFDYLLGGIHRGFFPKFLALDVDGVRFFVTIIEEDDHFSLEICHWSSQLPENCC